MRCLISLLNALMVLKFHGYKMRRIWTNPFWPFQMQACFFLKLWIFALLYHHTDGACIFPGDLRGAWLASNKGNVTFTSDRLEGYLTCRFEHREFCDHLPNTWECHETDGDSQYLIRTDVFTADGASGRLYACLYLTRLSSTKYTFAQGPQEIRNIPGRPDYLAVSIVNDDLAFTSVCNLESPIPATRQHVLVKEDSVSSSTSFCPTEFLASMTTTPDDSEECVSNINSCDNKKQVSVSNTTCSPRLLFNNNGTLSCLHSLAEDNTIYVILYNNDPVTDGTSTYQFTCVALQLANNTIYMNQQLMECDGITEPNSTQAEYQMVPNFWCPITCTFESSLQGSWLSNRKGSLTISSDTLSGFEPYGSSCTSCSGQPSDFECYQQSGTMYLIRSAQTIVDGSSVRIYVCLDVSFITSGKYIYYQAHSGKHSILGDYLTTLNAAYPVNSVSDVCTQSSPYPAQLFSVLLTQASPTSGSTTCPESLDGVYNSSTSACFYTVSTCDVDTRLVLSSTACDTSPFYTSGGVVSCIHSTSDSGTTFLTLLNHDNTVDGNSTHQFTCIAYSASSTNLQFSQKPGGCEESQTSTSVNASTGAVYTLRFQESCPTDDFPWIIIVAVLASVIGLVLIGLLVWYLCCGREWLARRRERKQKEKAGQDRESMIGQDSLDEGFGDGKKKDGKGGGKGPFKDVFTISTGKHAKLRKDRKSKLRRKRRKKMGKKGDGEYSDEYHGDFTSGSTDISYSSDDESFDSGASVTSEARRQELFGSRYNLHVALAWADRQNDPELVQDEHMPRSRSAYEKYDMLRQLEGPPSPGGGPRPPGRLVPISAVLGARGWRSHKKRREQKLKSKRDRSQNKDDHAEDDPSNPRSARRGFSQRNRKMAHLDGGVPGAGRPDDRLQNAPGGGTHGSLDYANIQFLAQYRIYTDTRDQLADEGFWDSQEKKETSENVFGFHDQESKLEPDDQIKAADGNDGDNEIQGLAREAEEAGLKERQKGERRVIISSKPPDSTIIENNETDTGIDTEFTSRENTISDIGGREVGDTSASETATSGPRDGASTAASRSSAGLERGSTRTTPDLMSRFYARLQELKETREDDEKGVTTSVAITARNRDRMRIKTALRKLLNSRLFPDKAKDEGTRRSSMTLGSRGDTLYDDSSVAYTSRTMTPLTQESRSKTISATSRHVPAAVTSAVRRGQAGKVVFASESSHLTSTSTDDPNKDEPQHNIDRQPPPNVGYYRRHPLAPIRFGGISRLYQPARPPTRARTSLSQSALQNQRDGVRRDAAFLQRIQSKQGLREDTRWSLPGEKGPQSYHSNLPTSANSWKGPAQNQGNVNQAWSYNMKTRPSNSEMSGGENKHFSGTSLELHDLDDAELRRLLEELYPDKKYMDKIIDTKVDDDQMEEKVCESMETGRDYLLHRALFWQEIGPLPPRPPTTDLGMRLQRERTMQSRMCIDEEPRGSPSRMNRMRSDLSRRDIKSSQQRDTAPRENQNPPQRESDFHAKENSRPLEASTSEHQELKEPNQSDKAPQRLNKKPVQTNIASQRSIEPSSNDENSPSPQSSPTHENSHQPNGHVIHSENTKTEIIMNCSPNDNGETYSTENSPHKDCSSLSANSPHDQNEKMTNEDTPATSNTEDCKDIMTGNEASASNNSIIQNESTRDQKSSYNQDS